jgi:hypothetical protein
MGAPDAGPGSALWMELEGGEMKRDKTVWRPALALVFGLLAACGSPAGPVAAPGSGATALPTAGLEPAVSAAWPLAEGATWRYLVRVEEPAGNVVRDEVVTEWVTGREQREDTTLFWMERQGQGAPERFAYAVRGNAVYQTPPEAGQEVVEQLVADLQAGRTEWQPEYVLPIAVGDTWGPVGTPTPEHGYEWFVEAEEVPDVPAGGLAGCNRLALRTNSGESLRWFCAGVGLARAEIRFQGTRRVETWALLGYPGMSQAPAATATAAGGEVPAGQLLAGAR